MTKETNPVDQSLKVLVNRSPAGFLRLAGTIIDPRHIRANDTAINVPEYRADNVHIVEEPGESPWALYVESHLRPDNTSPFDWFYKAAGLSKALEMPVILVVLYLEQGRYKTFPSSYKVTKHGLTNQFSFHTILLWKHAELIRKYIPELVPLILLCEREPREETLVEIRETIHSLPVSREEKADLLAVTMMLGSRHFTREVLLAILKEDEKMIEGVPWISDWIAEGEARGKATGEVIGEARGEARGKVTGEAIGKAAEAQQIALRLMRKRFGALSPEVVAQVEGADTARCEEIAERLLDAHSLKDLGLS